MFQSAHRLHMELNVGNTSRFSHASTSHGIECRKYVTFQSCIEFSRSLNMEMKLYHLSISVWSSLSVKTLVNMPYFSPFINFSIRRMGKYNYTMLQSTHRLLGQLNTCKWMPDFSPCIDVSSDALIETWHNLFAMFTTWQRNYTMFQSAHRLYGRQICINFTWSWIWK